MDCTKSESSPSGPCAMRGCRHGGADRTFRQKRQRRQREAGYGEKARQVADADAALHDNSAGDRIQFPDAIEPVEPNGDVIDNDFGPLGISVAKSSDLLAGPTGRDDGVADILDAGALEQPSAVERRESRHRPSGSACAFEPTEHEAMKEARSVSRAA